MKYSEFFERGTRANGEKFISLKIESPVILEELIYKIHSDLFNGSLPNDWIYDQIESAFLDQEDGEEIWPEGDVYNHDLYKWFGNGFADSYCNEAIEERASNALQCDIWGIISEGQTLAKIAIYTTVWIFLQEEEQRSFEKETQNDEEYAT